MMLTLYIIAGVIGYWLAGIVVARPCWSLWGTTWFDVSDVHEVFGLVSIVAFWPFFGFCALTAKLFMAIMRRDS